MGNLFHITVVILLIGWAIGFFVYGAGAIIQILLILAVIAILMKDISTRKSA